MRHRHQPDVAGHADAVPALKRIEKADRLAVGADEAGFAGRRGSHLAPVDGLHPVGRGIMVQQEAAAAYP